ncbi:MAG: integrase core domain-containing protein [Deinococcus sp.]|nr:integrase core domain-containing protein [Deinococcus sp.]MCL5965078.1 integrase core domain-containing protein [Deinococcus sp.]
MTQCLPGIKRDFRPNNHIEQAEYGAYDYPRVLHRHGLTPSMGRAYHSQDNAYMESFFHSPKAEWIRGREFRSFTKLRGAIKAYMRFYNQHRLRSDIDYHAPEE